MTDQSDEKKTSALAVLLADPDPGIAAQVRAHLASRDEDPPGLRDAVEKLEDAEDRGRAREARLEAGRDRAASKLVALAPSSEFLPDLETGALLVAKIEDPDVDTQVTRRKLDDLAEGARSAHRDVDGLAHYLGKVVGFRGDRADDELPRLSSLPEVLERKVGLPIALSVIYLLVGKRLGIPLYGVGAPLHFIVGVPSEPPCFLDPFDRGRKLDQDGVANLLQGLGVAFHPRYLAPTPSRQILARMARNLVGHYARRPRGEMRARRYQRIALAFEEGS